MIININVINVMIKRLKIKKLPEYLIIVLGGYILNSLFITFLLEYIMIESRKN